MSQHIRVMSFSVTLLLGSFGVATAQYGGAQYVRTRGVAADPVRAAVRTLLAQVDQLVEDLEVDLVRDLASEQLMTAARDVQDEVEHLAASVEHGADYNHTVKDFQSFDAQLHRLTRHASRFAADDRRLQRNLARVSETDAELHRLLRVPAPVDVEEVRVLATRLRRASEHLREDIETDLRGLWQQRDILERAARLEESAEQLEASIARGGNVQHLREDFSAVDHAWLRLAGGLRQLSPFRFDHVLRSATLVATSEGQLRSALGLEPNPDQFTCFRPAPSEVRGRLPYETSPYDRRVTSSPPPAPVQENDAGTSLLLGLLFGGDSDDRRGERSARRQVVKDEDESRPHEHERGQDHAPASQPIRRATPETAPAVTATVPPKPIDPALQAKIDKNLAKLSANDRAAAISQRTCPVTRELLGEHGAPIIVRVKDARGVRRDVFVCCDDCVEKLNDHPQRYLDRLPD